MKVRSLFLKMRDTALKPWARNPVVPRVLPPVGSTRNAEWGPERPPAALSTGAAPWGRPGPPPPPLPPLRRGPTGRPGSDHQHRRGCGRSLKEGVGLRGGGPEARGGVEAGSSPHEGPGLGSPVRAVPAGGPTSGRPWAAWQEVQGRWE